MAEARQEVGLHLGGGGKSGVGNSGGGKIEGRVWAYGDLNSAREGYGREVYCYAIASGPL